MNPFNLYTRSLLFEEATGETEGTAGATEETAETSEETTETEETEEAAAAAEEISEDEIKEAKNLYKLLKDPATQKDVLRVLASQAGLLEKVETKQDVKDAKKSVKDILKAKLGDKFDFLTPMLSEALEEILQGERAENAQQLGTVQQTQLNTEVQNVFNKLSSETKGASRQLESKMDALSKKFPPGADISVDEYVRGLYQMASSGTAKGNSKQIADRINRNSSDVPGRLASRSTGAGKDSPRNLGKLNLNQSIAHAMKSLGYDKGGD